MNLTVKSLLLLLVAGTLTVIACKKDDEKTVQQILTEKSCWGLTKDETLNSSTGQWIVNNIPPCTLDDCLTFKADSVSIVDPPRGTLTIDEGATKCDPSYPQTISGTWNEQTLTLLNYVFNIKELTENKLVVEGTLAGIQVRKTYEPK